MDGEPRIVLDALSAPSAEADAAADLPPLPPIPSDEDLTRVAAPGPPPPLPAAADEDEPTIPGEVQGEGASLVEVATGAAAVEAETTTAAEPASVETDDADGESVDAPETSRPDDADADADGLPGIVSDVREQVARDDAPAVAIRGLIKQYGDARAVDAIDLTIPAGSFYGIVGPNGAGKTTTLSMITGLLRADHGTIEVAGLDVRRQAKRAKKVMGVLPDRLRIFDRLTGRQLLYYYGVLRGLKPRVVEERTAGLARALDLTESLGRLVSDYSAGMTKKIMLAGALIHAPRVVVLDEPFEAVDPASSQTILDILTDYVAHGGTVILSSHGMALVERVCTRVAVMVAGQILAEGTVDEVRGEATLEERFIELAGGLSDVEGLEWLHTFSG